MFMEELDLLKKDWNKANVFEQVSEAEIYKMLHKKSSSTVRWILIISILELLLWSGSSFLFNADDAFKKFDNANLSWYMMASNIVHYSIVIVFIILFYVNYRKISVVTSTKNLMKSILKTRKTVQYYIWYNLMVIALSFVLGIILVFMLDPTISKLCENTNFKYGFIIGFALIAALIIGIFWMLYKVIYGRLLKKLYQNYEELKKIDF